MPAPSHDTFLFSCILQFMREVAFSAQHLCPYLRSQYGCEAQFPCFSKSNITLGTLLRAKLAERGDTYNATPVSLDA